LNQTGRISTLAQYAEADRREVNPAIEVESGDVVAKRHAWLVCQRAPGVGGPLQIISHGQDHRGGSGLLSSWARRQTVFQGSRSRRL